LDLAWRRHSAANQLGIGGICRRRGSFQGNGRASHDPQQESNREWPGGPAARPRRELAIRGQHIDKAMAINSMQVWPDAVAGLREMRRCMRTGGTVALGFTPNSGQPNTGFAETFTAAGFAKARVVEKDKNLCTGDYIMTGSFHESKDHVCPKRPLEFNENAGLRARWRFAHSPK
jgi:hypothetical protein